ncbi:MAG: hypothetical protein AAF787_13475 [Chloroflexota bacterium]
MASTRTTPQPTASVTPPLSGFPEVQQIQPQFKQVLARSQHVLPLPPPADVPPTAQAARLSVVVAHADRLEPAALLALVQHIEAVTQTDPRCDLLAQVAAHLPPAKQRAIVERLLESLPQVQQASVQARVLFRLLPLVDRIQSTPPASFMAVFDIARSIDSTEARTRSLIALSQYVPPQITVDIQRRVLETIDGMRSDTERASMLASLVDHLSPTLARRALMTAIHIETPEERVRAMTALARALPGPFMKQARDHVITAIEGIMGEEARAEALVAFAPYLEQARSWDEFPELLERALAVAVNIPRRQFRARALVALAPHLPSELQGEALAAVHGLPGEHERASMLAELARALPPDMLVASLAIAHTTEAVDARTHALTALARHVPPHAREQTVLDALGAAQTLSHDFERVTALVNLLDMLPVPLQQQALINALDAAEHIRNPGTQARALAMLGPYLMETMLNRALEIAQAISEPQKQLTACMALVERLPQQERDTLLRQMLTTVNEIQYEYRQARSLMGLASLLPPDLLPEAIDIAHSITEPYDRLSAIIALAQNSPPSQRPVLVGEAWKLLKTVESGYDRASALATIAPLLPPGAEHDLTHVVGMVIGSIMDEYDQASAIILLAPLLATDRARHMGADLPTQASLLRDGLKAAVAASHPTDRAALLQESMALWLATVDHDDTRTRDMLWNTLLIAIAALPLPDAVLCMGQLEPLLRHYRGENATTELLTLLAPSHAG